MYKSLKVVDGHADILYRMGKEGLSFYDELSPLQQNAQRLKQSGVDLQVFVTFVEQSVTPSEQLYKVLNSLHRFHAQIQKPGKLELVTNRTDLDRIFAQGIQGALLSLEGADALNGQIAVVHALFQLGIRWIGLTWNGANSLADGVGEERGGGLTRFGKTVVTTMEQLGMVVDVSHLAWRGVEDVLALARGPIVASHSNAYAVFPHRRNLPDELLVGIAATGGTVGITFVPEFVGAGRNQKTDDLLRHLEHILKVVGVDAVALGSDFDGISETLDDLRNGADYPFFLERIIQEFGVDVARKIAGENLLRVLKSVLK